MLEQKITELTLAVAALTVAMVDIDRAQRTMFSMMDHGNTSAKGIAEADEKSLDTQADEVADAEKDAEKKAAAAAKKKAAAKKAAEKKAAAKKEAEEAEKLKDADQDDEDDEDDLAFMDDEEDEKPAVTKKDVKEALTKLASKSKKGAKYAKAILEKHDASNLTQLSEDDYEVVIAKSKKAEAQA